MTLLRRLAVVLVLANLGGCGPIEESTAPTTQPTTAASSPVATAAPTATSLPTIEPTIEPRVELDDVPRLEIDPDRLLALCDPEPTQAFAGGPESHLSCEQVLTQAIGVFSLVTADPIERLYLRRAICYEGQPCPDDLVETGTVYGWTATSAYSFVIDARETSILVPRADPDAIWPSLPVPDVEPGRPAFEGAPKEVANRAPYPYCGRTMFGQPFGIQRCFLAAVLAGQRAETIEDAFGHEGAEISNIYRFDGRGSIRVYSRVDGNWRTGTGLLHLNPGGLGWSFGGWDGTDRALT